MAHDDDDVYTIEADIPEMHNYDAYLSSYRAYTGPQDGKNGIPLDSLPAGKCLSSENESTKTSEYSDSFIQYRPTSHKNLALLAAFLCFCPVGIAALVYSCRAQCAKNDGKFGKAAILGKSARDLAIASIILGIAMLVFIVLVVVLVCLPQLNSRS